MNLIHLRENYWAVHVPEGATDFETDNPLSHGDLVYYTGPPSILNFRKIALPPGTWSIVCTSKEVTEEQAVGMVDSSQWYFPVNHTRYVDYAYPFDREFKQRWSEGFGTAIDSLRSLLTSKGCDLNNNWLIIKKQ